MKLGENRFDNKHHGVAETLFFEELSKGREGVSTVRDGLRRRAAEDVIEILRVIYHCSKSCQRLRRLVVERRIWSLGHRFKTTTMGVWNPPRCSKQNGKTANRYDMF